MTHPIDPKEAAILRAAFECFARYGLRRTSMEDIAKGAGMSRPALYLHYAGKEDIFNALVRVHFERSEKAVARVLAEPGPAAEVLLAAFHAIDGEAVEAMLNSPHADEILSANAPVFAGSGGRGACPHHAAPRTLDRQGRGGRASQP